MIEVLATGALATIQDFGRRGFAAVGVPRSGAFDRAALSLANRLVGNAPDAAAVEFTYGGLALRFERATTIAVAGAEVPGIDLRRPVTLAAGSVVRCGVPVRGLRSYLAVRGGIDIAPELGSRSTDTLSGLGPRPLSAGDRLAIGTEPAAPIAGPDATGGPHPQRPLRLILGPRADRFAPDAVRTLTTAHWHVGADSDRIGVRLDGPALPWLRTDEPASEPTLPGAIQVPPDGRPIVFGPDSPVTGGYPVIAVLRRAELDLVAQLRPGDAVSFSG